MKVLIRKGFLGFLICFIVIGMFQSNVQAMNQAFEKGLSERGTRGFALRKDILPITAQDFVKPLWHPSDVIINAGDLGRYRFSADRSTYELPENVRIRPELIKLLNDLQKEFNSPVIIMSGYCSQRENIYLWARWLDDNPENIKVLNEKGLRNWEEWVNAGEQISDSIPLSSKNQIGDSVDFYWKGLDFQTENKKRILTDLIRELGGQRRYTDEEREKYNIAPDDNYLLRVVGYVSGERISVYNPWGYCYFHAEYQPSEAPPKPDINMIGLKLSDSEDAAFVYKTGEVVMVQDGDFMYLAKVTEDSPASALEVKAHVFCDEVREKMGDKVLKSRILTRREKPENGWGTRKVMIEYLYDDEWKLSMDVLEFEDYYLVPSKDGSELKVASKNVRIPIARIH